MKMDVTKHGTIPNTGRLLIKDFQKLIDNSPSGVVFYFPKGEYIF